jgi:hypothetical protein
VFKFTGSGLGVYCVRVGELIVWVCAGCNSVHIPCGSVDFSDFMLCRCFTEIYTIVFF